MTDSWDPSIPEHKAIAHGIEVGDGIAEMRKMEDAKKALKTVGYEVELSEDLAERPDEIPWYYPLEVRCAFLWYLCTGSTNASYRVICARPRPSGTISPSSACRLLAFSSPTMFYG